MINSPKFWYKENFLSKALIPISLIWVFVDLLKRKISNPYKSKLKIICIGNVNIGGSGKTPLCIYCFKILKKLNFNPIFLVSGYGGKKYGPSLVNLKNKIIEFSDEAYLLAKHGPTITSKNKLSGIKLIENNFLNHDIVIMDDGLQNYQVQKDLKILAVDRKKQFGNKLCVPSGPLRQTIKTCLNEINAIVITGNKSEKKLNLKYKKPKFETYIKADYKKISNKKNYIAFCGLADNEKFFETLEDIGCHIEKKINFPDHFFYTDKTIENLVNYSQKKKIRLITTEKDFVKIKKKFHKYIDILPIEIKMSQQEKIKFKSYLNKKLNV